MDESILIEEFNRHAQDAARFEFSSNNSSDNVVHDHYLDENNNNNNNPLIQQIPLTTTITRINSASLILETNVLENFDNSTIHNNNRHTGYAKSHANNNDNVNVNVTNDDDNVSGHIQFNDNDNDRFSISYQSINENSRELRPMLNNGNWIQNNSMRSSLSSSSRCSSTSSMRTSLNDISNRMNVSKLNQSFVTKSKSNSNNNISKTLNTSSISNTGMNTFSYYKSEIIMSIVEGRGKAKGEIGLAFIDIKSMPILNVSQFVDNYSFESLCSKCQAYTPIEIIFPHTMSSNNRMMITLIESFPNIIYRPFHRKFFNEKKGFDIIQMLSYDDCQWIDLQLETKYYCLASCSALFHYLIVGRQIQYAPKSIKIIYQSSLNTMIIDPLTAKILELIINLEDPKSWYTLFYTINRTKTKSGFILLRSNILQPTTNLELINRRLDMIEAISSSIEIFNSFENLLDSFGAVDLDQLLANITLVPVDVNQMHDNDQNESSYNTINKSNEQSTLSISLMRSSKLSSISPAIIRYIEKKIDYVINMKHIASLVDHLRTLLIECDEKLFNDYVELLKDPGYEHIKLMIDQVINSEAKCVKSTFSHGISARNNNTINGMSTAAMKLERCFAIKDRFNPMLDIARSMYSETIDDIVALAQAYEVKYSLSGIRLSFNSSKGFFMQIKLMKSDDYRRDRNTSNDSGPIFNQLKRFPSLFKDVHKTKNYISFTSDDLMRLNSRIRQSVEEIYLQSDNIITKLIEQIRTKISCLYNLADIVANIDLVYSFAYQSLCANWVRPQFNPHFTEIIQATHPILDNVCGGNSVPNSIFLSNDLNFHIITGPNMSGKTTFLKQIGLLQILAQIGSFVPAQMDTKFRLCDKIFTRMALNDNLQMNSSSFMVEIKELHYILEHISPNCLILIDELGRDSCPDYSFTENIALDNKKNWETNFLTYWSFCESLLMSQSSFTIFATHFTQLTSLSKYYFNVSNHHFSSEEHLENNLLCKYPHILRSGPSKEQYYGILLAEQSGLDERIVSHARMIAQRFRPNLNTSISYSLSTRSLLDVTSDVANAFVYDENVNNEIEDFTNEEEYSLSQAKYRMAAKLIHLLNTNSLNEIDSTLRRDLQILYEELRQELY